MPQLTVDTGMNTKPVLNGIKDLNSAIRSLRGVITRAGKDMDASVVGYARAMRNTVAASREAKVKVQELDRAYAVLMDKMDKMAEDVYMTPEYAELSDELRKQEQYLNRLLSARKKNNAEIQKTQSEINTLKSAMAGMRNAGTATQYGYETEEYRRLANQATEIINESNRIKKLANEKLALPYLQQWREMATVTGTVANGFARVANAAMFAGNALIHPFQSLNRLIPMVLSGLAQLAAKVLSVAASFARWAIHSIVDGVKRLASAAMNAAVSLAKMAGSAVVSFLRRLAEAAKNAAVQLARVAGKAVVTGLKGIGSLAAQAGKAILGIGKSAKRSNNGLGQAVKMLVKYGFGVRSVFILVRRLRSALVDAFKNMAKQVPEVNRAISSLSAALGMLKNSMATAFQPILNAIAPILVQLMDLLTEAMVRVGMFFAALTGQDYVYRATKANYDYAKSLDKTKQSAKEAKNQLASFDELNVLSAPNNSGSGAGTDANAADAGQFVKTPLESSIKEFVDTLKKMLKNGEFAELGQLLGDKINEFINSVDWSGYAEKIGNLVNGLVKFYNAFMEDIDWQNIGQKIADAINGLVDTIDWEALGRAFSQRINAIFGILAGLVDRINAANLGQAMSNALWGFFGNIHWEEIGSTIGEGLTKIADSVTEFAINFPWEEFATEVANGANKLFSKITPSSIGGALVGIINGGFKFLLKFLQIFKFEEHGKALQNGIKTFVEGIDADLIGESLKTAIIGILGYIKEAIDDEQTWRTAGSKLAFALNRLFGTHQAGGATVWTNLAEAIVTCAKDVIVALTGFVSNFKWGQAGTDFHDAVLKLIEDFPAEELGHLMTIALKGIIDTFGPTLTDPKVWRSAGVQFSTALNTFFGKKSLWEDAGKTVNGMLNNLLTFGQTFLGNFKADTAAKNIKAALAQIQWGEIATNVWETAKIAFKKAGDFLNVLFGEFDIDKYNLVKGKLDYPEELADSVIGDGSLASKIGNKIHKALSGIPWKSIGEKLWNSAKKALTVAGGNISDFMVSLLGINEKDVNEYGDAGAIGHKLADLISEAFKAAVDLAQYLLDSFDSDAFRSGLETILSDIDWISIMRGLLTSIGNSGKKALESIPFIGNWFKDQFNMVQSDDFAQEIKELMGSAFDKVVELGANKGELLSDKFFEGFKSKTIKDGKILPDTKKWLEKIFTQSEIIALEKGELTSTSFFSGLSKAGINSRQVTQLINSLEIELSDGAKGIADAGVDGYIDQANARKQDVQNVTEKTILPSPEELLPKANQVGTGLVNELVAAFSALDGNLLGNATVDNYFHAFEARFAENGAIKENLAATVDEILGAGATAAYNNGQMTPEMFWVAWQNHMRDLQPETAEAINSTVSDTFGGLSETAEQSGTDTTFAWFSALIQATLDKQGEAEDAVDKAFDEIWSIVDPDGIGAEAGDGYMQAFIRAVTDGEGHVKNEFKDVWDRIMDGADTNGDGVVDGKEFMKGIVKGMSGEENSTKKKLVGVIDSVLNYLATSKDGFDEHSPSKRAAGYGENFMKGFVQGTKSEESGTKTSTVGVFTSIFAGIVASAAALTLLNAAVSLAMTTMSTKISTTLTTVSTNFTTTWANIRTKVATTASQMATNVTTSMRTIVSTVQQGMNSVYSTINNSSNNMSRAMSNAMTNMQRAVSNGSGGIIRAFSNAMSNMQRAASNGMNSIRNTIYSGMSSLASAANSVNWWSIGDQIVAGIQRGVISNWRWLTYTVRNLAMSLFNSVRNILGIHSPSTLFRDGVGAMIGLGIAEGIDDTEAVAVKSIAGVADAMADKMNSSDMQFDIGTETALSDFSDKIADSFTTLLDRLQTIADSVAFRTPDVAAGTVMPYNVAANVGNAPTGLVETLEASNDDLANVVIQATNNAAVAIVNAIQRYGGGVINGDVSAQTSRIIDEINRRSRAQGAPVIIV